jgi:hypothetical protein
MIAQRIFLFHFVGTLLSLPYLKRSLAGAFAPPKPRVAAHEANMNPAGRKDRGRKMHQR